MPELPEPLRHYLSLRAMVACKLCGWSNSYPMGQAAERTAAKDAAHHMFEEHRAELAEMTAGMK